MHVKFVKAKVQLVLQLPAKIMEHVLNHFRNVYALLVGLVVIVNTSLMVTSVGVGILVVVTMETVYYLQAIVTVLLVIMECIVKWVEVMEVYVQKVCVKMEGFVQLIHNIVCALMDGLVFIVMYHNHHQLGIVKVHIVIVITMDIATFQLEIVFVLGQ